MTENPEKKPEKTALPEDAFICPKTGLVRLPRPLHRLPESQGTAPVSSVELNRSTDRGTAGDEHPVAPLRPGNRQRRMKDSLMRAHSRRTNGEAE
jgi:hypothetical protein